MKYILVIILSAVIIYGCKNNITKEKLIVDKILFSEHSFGDPDSLMGENLPPEYFNKAFTFYPEYKPRKITLINRDSVEYFINDGFDHRGYYKSILNEKTIFEINNLLNSINYKYVDTLFECKDKNYIYDGPSYYIFIYAKGEIKRIKIDRIDCATKAMISLFNEIDNLDKKLQLTRSLNNSLINKVRNQIISKASSDSIYKINTLIITKIKTPLGNAIRRSYTRY